MLIFVAAACFGFLGFFLRFGSACWPLIDGISENSFGIYFFHFFFVMWMQYAFLDLPLPAVIRGIAVLLVSLLLSWLTSIATWRMLMAVRSLLGYAKLISSGPRN